ncbi:MAG: hypothetical protein ACK4F9_00445 [Brevinematia bacterium]
MDVEKVRKFVELIGFYNREPSKRVFRVDRDCYVVFTGFSAIDVKPFVRIGYSNYIDKIKKYISNVVIAGGYLSSIKQELLQIKNDEFETNFIVPSSIYNVILKLLPSDLHHKVNVNVIDKSEESKEFSKVIKEITEKYKSYVLLYDDGNFAITFSGKKIFDLFSVMKNDLVSSKVLSLLSSKLYDVLPRDAIIKVGGNYVIRSSNGEILIATDEFDEKVFLKKPIPITTVKTVIGNEIVSLIDTIRLIHDRSRLRVFTVKSAYDDFKQFTLGINFVEVSDKINVISNLNITSSEGRYYIPLVDEDGRERNLVFSREGFMKNRIELDEGEYVLIRGFSKSKLNYFSTGLLIDDPAESDLGKEFDNIRTFIKQVFDKRIVLSDIKKEFELDNSRIINDRKRLEELLMVYDEVSNLPYSEKLNLLVKSEKLEGSDKEKEIKEFIKSIEEKGVFKLQEHAFSKEVSKKDRRFSFKINWKYVFVSFIVLFLLILGGVFITFRDSIYDLINPPTIEEEKISSIMSKLDNTYEPELTKIQNELGITITDYDIWVYVNKVAVINGYKPLTYKKPKKWEDPDWVYPGNKLKMLDDSIVVVRKNDNMWNISKRKIIEDYIKKNFNVTVKSRSGTNVYKVRKR